MTGAWIGRGGKNGVDPSSTQRHQLLTHSRHSTHSSTHTFEPTTNVPRPGKVSSHPHVSRSGSRVRTGGSRERQPARCGIDAGKDGDCRLVVHPHDTCFPTLTPTSHPLRRNGPETGNQADPSAPSDYSETSGMDPDGLIEVSEIAGKNRVLIID